MAETNVGIQLAFAEGKSLDNCNINEVGIALRAETDAFGAYLSSIGQGGLAPVEVVLLKTYLAWKLGYGPKNSRSNKDQGRTNG